jgi:hypothetical protein
MYFHALTVRWTSWRCQGWPVLRDPKSLRGIGDSRYP